jgi:predicted TIM-barrel fold metal-dependent hydrolase
MLYFDSNCEVGPRNEKDPAAPWSTEHLLHWMNHCGIDGALVVHTLSIHDDPVHARVRLAQEINVAPDRLFPVWTLLPPDAGDFERDGEQLLLAMNKENVRAVKLCPKTLRYPLSAEVLAPLLRNIEEQRILTLIDANEVLNAISDFEKLFDVLHGFLKAFPQLPVLLQRAIWLQQRVVCALMQRHSNLHLEFSSYQINRGLEEYSRRFGVDRLIFGSGLPTMSAGAARFYVDYAQIPTSDKEKISGGNLIRLLKGLTPAAAPARPLDALTKQASEGVPLSQNILLDAHCHILHEGAQGAGGVVMYQGDADGLVEIKDVMGVQKTAIMSWTGPAASDSIPSNDVVARAVQKYPERFLGVVYIDPSHLNTEDLMNEVRFRVEEQGFVALKPYLRTGIKYNDPLYSPCWEYADERGLYALLHTEGRAGSVEEVVSDLAETYPDVQWIVAHTGGSFEFARRVVEVMKKHQNVWAELTLTAVTNGVIEWMVEQIGDDRILFGTDAPMRDPRPQLGWVVWADLPLQSRRKIMGENFEHLLNMRKQ